VGLGLLAVEAGSRPGGDIPGKAAPNKSGRSIVQAFGDNWAKNTCRDVANQALSVCLSKSNFKGCTVKQALRFRTAILLSGHSFKVDWICSKTAPVWVGMIENQRRHFSSQADKVSAH
jgi:hypothetical protein